MSCRVYYFSIMLLFTLMVLSGVVASANHLPSIDEISSGSASIREASRFFDPSRILICPKKEKKGDTRIASGLNKLHFRHKAKLHKEYPRFGNLQVIDLPKGTDIASALKDYTKSGLVKFAQPDYIYEPCIDPNDYYYANGTLWGLSNANDTDIDAPEAWSIIAGLNLPITPSIVVALIDSGVRYTHQDLAGNMWINTNETPGDEIDNDANGYVDDIYGMCSIDGYVPGDPYDDCGHGTHCAGIIGAVGNNGVGIVGVAWQLPIKIMALKSLNRSGKGTTSDIVECIDYAITNDADIISMSLGGLLFDQVMYSCIEQARAQGIIVATASGNSGANTDYSNPSYPACYELDNVVSVAAIGVSGDFGDGDNYSNYGLESVDLVAPGIGIMMCDKDSDSDYCNGSGTSMAAPHVAGALALLKAQYPNDNYHQTIIRLLDSVEVLPSCAGLIKTSGRLNLYNALTYDPDDFYVSLPDTLSFGGMPGGQFSQEKTILLTNFSNSNINWTVSTSATWQTVTPQSGTISPNQTVAVTVSINSSASLLSTGRYTSTITVIDTSNQNTTLLDSLLVIGPAYVDTEGSNNNNGTFWALAKQTIQAAIDDSASGVEIWVKAGTYRENIKVKGGVELYGGFSGNENSRDLRNWVSNETIINADLNGNETIEETEKQSVATFHVGAPSNTRIDGFTLCNGSGTPRVYSISHAFDGCGIYCAGGSPVIANNKIIDNLNRYSGVNKDKGNGGGIFCIDSQAIIAGNTISGNAVYGSISAFSPGHLLGYGSGIYVACGSPAISGNVISDNVSDTYSSGGGIHAYLTSALITDNCVTDNTAVIVGGIECLYDSSIIANNYISSNSGALASGICSENSQSMIINNRISANSNAGLLLKRSSDEQTDSNNLAAGNTIFANATGIRIEDEYSRVLNNSVVYNIGNGIHIDRSGNRYIHNNISSFNGNVGIYSIGNYSSQLRNNCVYGNSTNYSGIDPGQGDISSNPLFVNSSQNDYHLTGGSSCMNAGWDGDSDLAQLTEDFDGEDRQNNMIDIGADELWGISTAQTKERADGSYAYCSSSVVTRTWPDYFYIEADNRTSAIRVELTSHGFCEDDRVDVAGTLATTSDGERYITASGVIETGSGSIAPLAMNSRVLGGGDYCYDALSGAGQNGVFGGYGWNNIGLLTRIAGNVTQSGQQSFYLDDGGNLTDASANLGVQVILPDNTTAPTVGSKVIVTGISSCLLDGSDNCQPVIRVGNASEISVQGSAATATGDIYSGFTRMSAMLLPYNPDPLTVFAGAYDGIDGQLFGYDPITQAGTEWSSWDTPPGSSFGKVLLGNGYELWQSASGTYCSDGFPDGMAISGGSGQDITIGLPGNKQDSYTEQPNGGGWHLIGNPLNHTVVVSSGANSRIKFTDGSALLTWSEAVSEGWVATYMTGLDSSAGDFTVRYDGVGDEDYLRVGSGYWLQTYKDDIAMIISAQ